MFRFADLVETTFKGLFIMLSEGRRVGIKWSGVYPLQNVVASMGIITICSPRLGFNTFQTISPTKARTPSIDPPIIRAVFNLLTLNWARLRSINAVLFTITSA